MIPILDTGLMSHQWPPSAPVRPARSKGGDGAAAASFFTRATRDCPSSGQAVLCSHLPGDAGRTRVRVHPLSVSLFFRCRENKHSLNFRLDHASEGRASFCSLRVSFPAPAFCDI